MLAKNLFMLKRRHYFVIMFSTDALKFVCLFFLRRNIFTVVLNFGCHEQSISINSNRCIFSNVRQTMIFFHSLRIKCLLCSLNFKFYDVSRLGSPSLLHFR